MPTNQLLPFANGETPNVMPYAEWNALAARLTGFKSGIASSQQFNYILSQGGAAGYVIGQLVADFAKVDATLNATELYTSFKKAVAAFVPPNIANGSIAGTKIANDSITATQLAPNSVTASELADKAVDTAAIVDSAVTTAKIANGAITEAKLATGSVTNAKVAENAINTDQIVDDAITAAKIADGAVGNAAIASGAITGSKIGTGAVGSTQLAANAVIAGKIAANAVTNATIANGAVTSAKIANGAVGDTQLATGAVTTAKIADEAVTTGQIADAAVTADKMAADSVSSAAIQDNAVTAAQIASGAVGNSELANKAVTGAKIADATITATQLANGTVSNVKIANGAVSFAKIASGDIATQAEAEAGTASNCLMTPQRVAQAIDAIAQQAPTGMLACFACTAIPEGWLACNGANVSRTTYAKLFAAIGTKYGSGNGSSTFTLPNLEGRFLECTTNTSQVGKMIEAGLPNITGDYQALSAVNWQQANGAFYIAGVHGAIAQGIESQTSLSHMNFTASRLSAVFGNSQTVQPKSVRTLICIRS